MSTNTNTTKDTLAQVGSILGGLMFMWAVFQQFFPRQLRDQIEKYSQRLVAYVYPFIQIRFNEFTGERLKRSEAYSAIENYLASNASHQAKRLKADVATKSSSPSQSQSLVLSMDDNEEVSDEFRGAKLWWSSGKTEAKKSFHRFGGMEAIEWRHYKLAFHRRHRELVLGPYLSHVIKEGRAVQARNRQRRLYTNGGGGAYWSHVAFEHPASFDTLAMDPEDKRDIVEDLEAFGQAEEFYARTGRAWKRGYLLHGPPGTGKSTMVAAMANLLNYDIYDLELTAVKDNAELRRLLIEITSKSITVIEDIDCSLDLTGQRNNKDDQIDQGNPNNGNKKEAASRVTLSGLLNFIDGIWSACGGERIVVFTTNHVEKLDPALIRKGRMDKHVELSFCGFEAFKVLALNYLGLRDHRLFARVSDLLPAAKITPADVAEHLMPKSTRGGRDCEALLRNLVQALENEARQEEEVESAKGKLVLEE